MNSSKEVFHREYDLYFLANEISSKSEELSLLKRKYLKIRKDKTSWKSLFTDSSVIDPFIGEKAISTLENTDIEVKRNVFCHDTDYFVSPTRNIILFPTYRAREVYKAEFVNFLGNVVSKNQGMSNEYNELLGLLYEYLYLKETDTFAKDTFEAINLPSKLKDANILLKVKPLYEEDDNRYDDMDYFRALILGLHSFSSLEASLQLISKMDTDKDDVIELIKAMGNEPQNIESLVKEYGIDTYGYPEFRKVLKKTQKK